MARNLTVASGTPTFNTGVYGQAYSGGGVLKDASAAVDAHLYPNGDGGALGAGTLEGIISNGAAPSTSERMAFGRDGGVWVGINTSNRVFLAVGANRAASTLTATTARVWAVDVNPNGTVTLYAAGSQVAQLTGQVAGTVSGSVFSVGGSTIDAAKNYPNGRIDEVRVSTTRRRTAAYTPETAAFVADQPTAGLYHLDGNANDDPWVNPATPLLGTITATSAGGTDTISYPAPTANPNPIAGVSLYEGTSPGGEDATAVATNTGGNAGSFTRPSPSSGQKFYVVRAYDNAATPAYSGPSNEVSTGTPPVPPQDPNLVYSPYNWDVTAQRAIAVNPGAYFKVLLTGSPTAVVLNFDMAGVDTGIEAPQLKYRIDDGGWTTVPVAANVSIPLPSTNTWGKHFLTVVLKSTSTATSRWGGTSGPGSAAIKFLGITPTPLTVTSAAQTKRALNVLLFGDSITEGLRTLAKPTELQSDPQRSDATQGWAWQLGEALGAEVGIVGFSGTGVVTTGVDVPPLTSTFDKLYGGGPARSFTTPAAPDVIVIMHGQNDNTADIVSALSGVVEALLAATPKSTLIALVRPLSGREATNIQTVVANASQPSRVKYIDTTGWWSSSDGDGVHPFGYANTSQITPRMAAAVRGLLKRGASYLKRADGSWKLISPLRV